MTPPLMSLTLRDKLFPGVPLVFCGVNNFKDERLSGQMAVTGVLEDFDIKGTIELIIALHKQASHLAVISDSTETGAANRERFRKVASVFSDRLKFLELFDLSTEELLEKLAKLPPDAVILNLSFFRDRLGQSYSTWDGNQLIARHSGRPIYSCWDFYLVGGALGGYVVSGHQQGEAAASMAAAILKGIQAEGHVRQGGVNSVGPEGGNPYAARGGISSKLFALSSGVDSAMASTCM